MAGVFGNLVNCKDATRQLKWFLVAGSGPGDKRGFAVDTQRIDRSCMLLTPGSFVIGMDDIDRSWIIDPGFLSKSEPFQPPDTD